jgi:hypothetical protein
MQTAQEIADDLKAAKETLRGGALRFFGDWFGGPMGNYHAVVDLRAEQHCLLVRFDESELLRVWDPDGLTRGTTPRDVPSFPWPLRSLFTIERASRVRWEWYPYGEWRLPWNLQHDEYFVTDGRIEYQTNSRWPSGATVLGFPAVEFIASDLPPHLRKGRS